MLDPPLTEVLGHRRTWDDGSLLALHNLSPEPLVVPLQLPDLDADCELEGPVPDGRLRFDEKGRAEISLDGYGYRWLRVVRPGDRRLV